MGLMGRNFWTIMGWSQKNKTLKEKKQTIMSANSIWRTIELVSTSISMMSISPFAVGLPSLFFALEFELMVKMFPSSLVVNPNTNPRASSHRFFKYWPGKKYTYSGVRNKRKAMFNNLELFSRVYVFIKGGYVYSLLYFLTFLSNILI